MTFVDNWLDDRFLVYLTDLLNWKEHFNKNFLKNVKITTVVILWETDETFWEKYDSRWYKVLTRILSLKILKNDLMT